MPLNQKFQPALEPEWTWGDPSQFTPDPSALVNPETPEVAPVDGDESTADPIVIGTPWLDVVMGLVIFATAQLLVAFGVILVYMAVTNASLLDLLQPQGTPSGLNPVLMWSIGLSTIAMAWGWAHVGNRTPTTFLKWGFKPQDILWGLGMVLVSGGLGFGLTKLFGVTDTDAANLNAMIWPSNLTLAQAIATGLAVGVIIPIAEELVFRGMIQNALVRKLPAWLALVITTVLFAVPHITNYIFLDIEPIAVVMALIQVTLLGLLIGGLLLKTDRIGPSIMAHIANNSMVVVVMMLSTFGPMQ